MLVVSIGFVFGRLDRDLLPNVFIKHYHEIRLDSSCYRLIYYWIGDALITIFIVRNMFSYFHSFTEICSCLSRSYILLSHTAEKEREDLLHCNCNLHCLAMLIEAGFRTMHHVLTVLFPLELRWLRFLLRPYALLHGPCREYHGYLTTNYDSHYWSFYICLDASPGTVPGSGNNTFNMDFF